MKNYFVRLFLMYLEKRKCCQDAMYDLYLYDQEAFQAYIPNPPWR